MLDVSCITKEADQISYSDAVLKGTATALNLNNSLARAGFCYVSEDVLKKEGFPIPDLTSILQYGIEESVCTVVERAEVTLSIKNLQIGTTYYYVCLVRIGQQVFNGEIKSFHTKDPVSQMQIQSESNITQTRAVLNAAITVEEDSNLFVEALFYYSDSESTLDALLANGQKKKAQLDLAQGLITVELASLKLASTYHYVFCCTAGGKTYYSEVSSFSTLDAVVSTNSVKAARVLVTTATLRGQSLYESDETNYSWEHEGCFYFSQTEKSEEGLKAYGTRVEATNNEDGSFKAVLTGLTPGVTYYYVASSKINGREYTGQVCTFSTKTNIPEEAIDLGLSVLWASCNVGASSPEESGDFYAWGENATKDHYNEYNYKWGKDWDHLNKYNFQPDRGPVDNKTVLDPEDDVAHIRLGGYWKTPTYEDIAELVENCTMARKNVKGQWGVELTSKLNGARIFLPQSGIWLSCDEPNNVGEYGYYWSSSLDVKYSNLASILSLDITDPLGAAHRCSGMTIRPVWE